ncbi:plastid/chloroplast ribosomal protein S1 [Haematococcus lacustris]
MRATSGLVLGQRPRIAFPTTRNVPVRRLTVARWLTRVSAIEERTSAPEPSIPDTKTDATEVEPASQTPLTEETADLELSELDAAQEQLLSWMMFTEEAQQEEELDEMVDYDEFGDEEYAELFEEVDQMVDAEQQMLKVGDKVKGVVYAVDDDGAYVEIGDKASGFVPLEECSFAKLKTPLEVLRVGMEREFVVIESEDAFGQTVMSLATDEVTVFWHRMRQLMEEDVTVYVKVESANKGGLLVKYGPYDGFIPVSQVGPVSALSTSCHVCHTLAKLMHALLECLQQITPETMESLVGYDLPAKFLEIDEERDRLVFSNKRASAAGSGSMQNMKIGDVVEGVVQSIKPYGAFVDLGGISGLLHISQITQGRILSVERILKEGDKLKVMVLSHDRDRGRVTLSTKKLEPNPGDMLRDPQLVFDKAEEMAEAFKSRVAAAVTQAGMEDAPGDLAAPEPYTY